MLVLLFTLLTSPAQAGEIAEFARATFASPNTIVINPVGSCLESKGKVKKVQLRVSGAPVSVNTLDVVFKDGRQQRLIANRLRLDPGQSSGWMSLQEGGNICLRSLSMAVGASGSSQRATVVFMGDWEK